MQEALHKTTRLFLEARYKIKYRTRSWCRATDSPISVHKGQLLGSDQIQIRDLSRQSPKINTELSETKKVNSGSLQKHHSS